VEHLDYTTGLLLDTLAEAGIDDRTLVVFTSDNGSIACDGASNGPLRGCKGTTWEGGMRVPCIMRWPGKIPAGSWCSELTTAMDLMPTLANLAGGTLPAHGMVDGGDIRPLIFGDPGAHSPHDAFFYYQENNLNAVRSGRWKLHLQESMLVDLASDIGETTDLSAVQPGVVARLQQLADMCRKDLGDGRLGIVGENCRPAGRVDKPRTLTSLELDDPYLAMAYD
jgi:arylsulfatase A